MSASSNESDPVAEVKSLFCPPCYFHGEIGHPNFGQTIDVDCEISSGSFPDYEGEWSAMGQSALMKVKVNNDGEIEIRMYGPDEEEEPTLAKGKFGQDQMMKGEVFSEGEGGGNFDFKMGKGEREDDEEEEESEEEEEEADEEEEKTEQTEKKEETDARSATKVEISASVEKKMSETASPSATSAMEALSDVPRISACLLFNYLSSRHLRLLLLDARSEKERKKGVIPRSVPLEIPEGEKEVTLPAIQSWLPGRKEKLAMRSYRLYQTVIVGESDSLTDIAYKIAEKLNERQLRGGSSQGSLSLLRGGYSAFEALYAPFCDPDSSIAHEGKGHPAFLHPMNYPSEIIDRYLFLGTHRDAENKEILKALGVTHVLIISKHKGPFNPYPGEFEYARLGVAEGHDEALSRASQFISAANAVKGDRIIVCGVTGNSAAAAVVIGYIMKKKMLTLKHAYNEVQNRRASICLSRPRWESLSRVEQELLKEDTLESCIDLSRAPPSDADEPMPLPKAKKSESLESKEEKSSYHKAKRIKWGVNDYLQNKSERLVALVTTLNTRYISRSNP